MDRAARRSTLYFVCGRSIDFPGVSSRCSRLNEVTDFQWLAIARMTDALLANSTLNLHSSIVERATTLETLEFSRAAASKDEYYACERDSGGFRFIKN